jgi:hypothetical protein
MKAEMFILMWIALLVWESLAQGTNRVHGDLFEYEFLRSDCSKMSYPDSTTASLIGSLNTYSSSCLASNGISHFAQSAENISRIIRPLGKLKALTLEYQLRFEGACSMPTCNLFYSRCCR